MNRKIGTISQQVIDLLELPAQAGTAIFIGDANIAHMKEKHPADYDRYKDSMSLILDCPDYVGRHPSNGSIEYVKEFQINEEFVKIAVRISGKGTYFARSMYVLKESRVKNFINKGKLLPVQPE